MTIEKLMQEIGCNKWPERWNDIFDDAVKTIENGEFLYSDPEYYQYLNDRYNMMDGYLTVFKDAAEEIKKDEHLNLLLALLCEALKDRENIMKDLKEYEHPATVPEGKSEFAYNMLTGLAVCSMADYTYNLFKKRNIPEEQISKCMATMVDGVNAYKRVNNGEPGYRGLEWYQHAIEGHFIPMGRLEIEVDCKFYGYATIFKNKDGETIALAEDIALHRSGFALGSKYRECDEGSWTPQIVETDEYWEGHPYTEDSSVSKETVKLYKTEWEKVLRHDDNVIGLHIPPHGKLSPELIDKTIEDAKAFLKEYYPDYEYKAFMCSSWLLDPQLIKMLGEASNIVKFNKRFKKLTIKCPGRAVFDFVFLQPDNSYTISELEANTTLEKLLKKHYMQGKAIYETTGYFLD